MKLKTVDQICIFVPPPPKKIKNSKHMIKLTNIILNSFAGTTCKCLSTTKAEFGIQWFKTPDSHLT